MFNILYDFFKAVIEVKGINHQILTTKRGQFWRLLSPGTYEVSAHAYDYDSSDPVTVTVDATTRRHADPINFQLRSQRSVPTTEQKAETSYTHRSDGFVRDPSFNYHHYDDLKTFLAFYAHTYPNITRLYSIGKSVRGRDLWVMEITDNPGVHEPLEPGKL